MVRESPIRLETGEISCPKCDGILRPGQTPFKIRGELVGSFDALVCSGCDYFVLTSSGYDKAIHQAQIMGLVGPEETSETEIYEKQTKVAG